MKRFYAFDITGRIICEGWAKSKSELRTKVLSNNLHSVEFGNKRYTAIEVYKF